MANLPAQADSFAAEIGSQVAGYLKTLEEKYEVVEMRLAVFAKPNARKGNPSTFAPGRARRTASAKGAYSP